MHDRKVVFSNQAGQLFDSVNGGQTVQAMKLSLRGAPLNALLHTTGGVLVGAGVRGVHPLSVKPGNLGSETRLPP